MVSLESLPGINYDTLYMPESFGFVKNEKAFIITKSGKTAIVDEESFVSLKKGEVPSELKSYFIQRGLLLPKISHTIKNNVTYFIIDLVKNCNFDCIYCFRDLQDKRIISRKALDDILDFIRNYCEEKRLYCIGLQMWGGEPLLALDRIEYAVNYFMNTKITANVDIETNGSLVTDEVAKLLHKLRVRVGVSIDGTPELQNKQRPFTNGAPTAIKVEEGIRNLQYYYGDSVGGITVVTKHNYRFIKEMLDYYIYHLQMKSLKFNIVRDNPNAAATGLSLATEEVTWFANELVDYLYAFQSLGKCFHEGNIDTRVNNLLYQCNNSLCISNGCQGGRSILSFNQDGGIFPCEMTDFLSEQIGSIYSDSSLDEMIDNAIHKNSFYISKEAEKCRICPWWCYCGGGCTSRNRYMEVVGKPDECECALNLAIYPRIVEEILDGKLRV